MIHTVKAPKPRAIVVQVNLPREDGNMPVLRDAEERLNEAVNLTLAIEVEVVHGESVNLSKITPATLIGGGKVEEIAKKVADFGAELVVVDAALSPRQQRELELGFKAKVLDRTGLILEIFGARARTKAGVLQVEMAQLAYQQGRLVRQWTHLERQRGGSGKTGGPGERQIELDKRMLRDRMAAVKRDLGDVEQTRGLQRMARQKANLPTVALVGYTNAGKSSLFNRMVDAGTLEADALFATLDPLMRKLELPHGLEVVLVDTVGFVADLPHELVEAFKATLEEVVLADLLLHVHDAANPEREAQAADVVTVLKQIGAGDKPTLHVWNKLDKVEGEMPLPKDTHGVSALKGTGIKELLLAIENRLTANWLTEQVVVDAGDGKRLAWLYAHGKVLEKRLDEQEWHLTVQLREADLNLWRKLS